jgi:uncharacterized protein
MNDKTATAEIESAPAAQAPGQPSPVTLRRAIALTAAASLLVGIIVGPIIANHPASATDTTTAPEHLITVSGVGTVSVKPDVADVTLGITVSKTTAKEARDAAATAMTAVIAAVKKDGVADKDIVTINVSLNPTYDYSSGSGAGRLVGYQFSNTVKITVHDLNKVAAIVDDSVAAGATNVQGIAFRVNDPTIIQNQARQLAMTAARSNANALAQAAGVSIKGVASISESGSSPVTYYPTYAAGVKDSASTPIQTGTTDVTIQVSVAYLIG